MYNNYSKYSNTGPQGNPINSQGGYGGSGPGYGRHQPPPSNYQQSSQNYHQRSYYPEMQHQAPSHVSYNAPGAMTNQTDGNSIRSSGMEFHKTNLRNQFLSNTNSSSDNVRYNRLDRGANNDDDDFDFGGNKENAAFIGKTPTPYPDEYEMTNLHNRSESPPLPSPPLPPSPQLNPFDSHPGNSYGNTDPTNKPFVDYQSYPYNDASSSDPPSHRDPFQNAPLSYLPDKAQPPPPDEGEYRQKMSEKARLRQLRSKPRFHYTRLPYFGILVSAIQVIVFIVELVKMSQLTGSAFQTKPYFNPMLGPSTYLIVNMGARYVPCMNSIKDITSDPSISFPCPNSTAIDTNVCNLSELCGLSGIPLVDGAYEPHQWYRIITPIFLHAGFLHILFNLLLQVSMGFSIERVIGIIKYALIYMISGISGFLLGANFSQNGVASCGGSGALFGVVATNLVMFLYSGKKNSNMYGTKKYGLFIVILIAEIVVSFVLGLLPGLDNFSHIGGFAAGLLSSILLLRDPFFVYRDGIITYQSGLSVWEQFKNNWNPMYNFEDKITSRFYIWCGVRVLSLVLLIVYFALLIKNFFGKSELTEANGCKWCKYISCLPVNGWCDQGVLEVSSTTSNDATSSASATARASATNTEPGSIENSNYSGQKRADLASKRSVEFMRSMDTFKDTNSIGSGFQQAEMGVGVIFFVVLGLIAVRFFKTRKGHV